MTLQEIKELAARCDREGLTEDQRAMLLVEIFAQEEAERRETAASIRKATPKQERRPCRVCLRYRPITEQHHVIPVALAAASHPDCLKTEHLCPNCHAIVHGVISGALSVNDEEVSDMLTLSQWERCVAIIRASGQWKGCQVA
jgi:hypothetical protein